MIELNVFSLCHINIRSMKANLTSFEICLQNLEFEFSVIGITETWLTDSNSDLYNINGFNFVETHRTGRSGGGVGIFLRNNILYQIRSDLTLNNEFSESIFIEIDKDLFTKNRNIIIGVIYRPPNADLKLFNDDINELLDTLEREHKYCYLVGIYDINLLNYSKHAETTSFIDILYAHSFLSLINRPTRVAKESATSIDNIFTNCYSNIDNTLQCLIYTDVSDHFPIVHVDFGMKLLDTDPVMTRRNLCYKKQTEMSWINFIHWVGVTLQWGWQTNRF